VMQPTWQTSDGSVRLYLGDCLEVLPTLEAGSVDAVVTDPPWMDYETGRYDASEWHAAISLVDPERYAGELYRISKENTASLLWCRWDCFDRHAMAMAEAGFMLKNCVVWAKPNHTAGDLDGNLGNMHEMAVFACRGRWLRHGGREVNLWQEPHLFSRDFRHHPTQKPDGLMVRSVNAVADVGDWVLDPFMGSGTTGVACVRTGRKFIGVEKEEKYFDIAVRRIEAELGRMPLFQEPPKIQQSLMENEAK
jgi:DNA modification methylase